MNASADPLSPDAESFAALLRPGGRLMGIDLGTKTIGVALSDVGRQVASPFETLRRTKFGPDSQRLADIARAHGVCGIVVGFPLNMDGTVGPRAQASRAFARNIAAALSLPVLLWDERMSTMAVERTLIEADLSRAKRAEVVDRAAAAYILQGVLDRLSRLARP